MKYELYLSQATFLVVIYAILLLVQTKRRKICRELSLEKVEIREKYLSRLINGNDPTSINIVFMNKSTFFLTCAQYYVGKRLLRDILHMSVKEQ